MLLRSLKAQLSGSDSLTLSICKLSSAPNDCVEIAQSIAATGLQALPFQARSFFGHAYQSLIWNATVVERLGASGELRVLPGK